MVFTRIILDYVLSNGNTNINSNDIYTHKKNKQRSFFVKFNNMFFCLKWKLETTCCEENNIKLNIRVII